MQFDAATTVAFTGHRTYDDSANERLFSAVRSLYDEGFRTFLSGMAAGFDLAAAEAVLALRNELSVVRLVCVVPFKGQQTRFSPDTRVRYERVIACADLVLTLAPHYAPDVYFRRNDFLVANSSVLVACFSGAKGGTAYTVRQAARKPMRIINIWRDPQRIFDF